MTVELSLIVFCIFANSLIIKNISLLFQIIWMEFALLFLCSYQSFDLALYSLTMFLFVVLKKKQARKS